MIASDDEQRFQAVLAADVRSTLELPGEEDDKYRRGVVQLATGSLTYPGAAVLSAQASCRAGAGMVRYAGPERVAAAVLAVRPEVVHGHGQYQCLVIGSGIPDARDDDRGGLLAEALERGVPAIVDAGALSLVEPGMKGVVVTPHARELAGLMRRLGLADWSAEDVARSEGEAAIEASELLGCTVLLKGRVTYVVEGADRRKLRAPNSWLATAGTGDVLAGIIGTIVAGQAGRGAPLCLATTVAAGAWLHARAGWLASQRNAGIEVAPTTVHAPLSMLDHGPHGGPILASDVATALPGVIAAVLAK